jgi:hypothetical protein
MLREFDQSLQYQVRMLRTNYAWNGLPKRVFRRVSQLCLGVLNVERMQPS